MSPSDPPAPEDRHPPIWVLRRNDQLGVAVLVVLSCAAMGLWYVTHGGCRGRLIEIEQIPSRTARFEVDINSAQWPELTQLPGLGEQLARRIVQDRQDMGPFGDLEDLRRVNGIGPKTLDRLRPYLRPIAPRADVAIEMAPESPSG